jgi:invasion protein IalB
MNVGYAPLLSGALCLIQSFGLSAAAEGDAAPLYRIKGPDVVLPAGLAPGQFQRVIEPFRNWTMICDVNLRSRQRVCNITQSVVDHSAVVVFSWSLAGSANGDPGMILRVPSAVGAGQRIGIRFAQSGAWRDVKTTACDRSVCVGILAVDAQIKAYIRAGESVDVSYTVAGVPGTKSDALVIPTTLAGLAEALDAL